MIPDSELRVLPRHARAVGICVSGQKIWMERHGFVWRTWIKEGYPADVLVATGDHFALLTVAKAREEADHGR